MKPEEIFGVCIDLPVRQLSVTAFLLQRFLGNLSWEKVLLHIHLHCSCSPLANQRVPERILYHVHILPSLSPLAYTAFYNFLSPKGVLLNASLLCLSSGLSLAQRRFVLLCTRSPNSGSTCASILVAGHCLLYCSCQWSCTSALATGSFSLFTQKVLSSEVKTLLLLLSQIKIPEHDHH